MKDWKAILAALPNIFADSSEGDCSLDFDPQGNAGLQWDEYPGAALYFKGAQSVYDFPGGEVEGYDRPATKGDFIELGLTELLSSGTKSFKDETQIDKDDLDPELVSYMWGLAADTEPESIDMAAVTAAHAIIERDKANEYLVHSPRGFNNEIDLYSVREGEKEDAQAWIEGQLNPHNSNEWYKWLTVDEAKEVLRKSWWADLQTKNNNYWQGQVETLGTDHWKEAANV